MSHSTLRVSACVMLCLTSIGCTSKEEKERRATAAMIEQAKADIAAESLFVQDSIKLAASFSVDTVLTMRALQRQATDRDGNDWTDTVYQIFTRDSAKCMVDGRKFSLLSPGDTLSCQWETRK